MSNRDFKAALLHRVSSLASGVRIGKFVSVGAIGAASDFAVLITLTEVFGVLPELSNLVSIETAILVMFLINENWTFADEGSEDRASFLGRLKRSHAVRFAGSLTQWLIFVALLNVTNVEILLGELSLWTGLVTAVGLGAGTFASFDAWLIVAKVAGISVAMTVNYVFESLFTWRVHRE